MSTSKEDQKRSHLANCTGIRKRIRKDRRNNMVIFGIKECEAMSGKEKQEIDLKEVQKIL